MATHVWRTSAPYVLCSSLIWTCRILNVEYLLLFFAGRHSGKDQNKCSKFDTGLRMGDVWRLIRNEHEWPPQSFRINLVIQKFQTSHTAQGGIASICFKFHFQTDHLQTLRTRTQGCQGCQKNTNFVRNWKNTHCQVDHPPIIE